MGSLTPLQVLYDSYAAAEPGAAGATDLPPELAEVYGGPLRLDRPGVYANFVATIDGTVALPGTPRSNRLISGGSTADRFVMGLLRARADAVLIGAGTLHASRRTLWTAEDAYPPAATAYADLRRALGLPATPTVAIVSRSGQLDTSHPVFAAGAGAGGAEGAGGAVVLTTAQGAERLGDQLPSTAVLTLGDGDSLEPAQAVEALRRRGHRHILSEAGPHLFGAMLAAGLVDELFLTQSPLLAGRADARASLQLVEGTPLLPDHPVEGRLVSVRLHGADLFLRYAF